MAWKPERRLLVNPSTPAASWATRPPPGSVAQAALEYFAQRLSAELTAAGLTASDLTRTLGDSDGAWRHKLNGTRMWTLEDVLAVALALNVPLPDPLWRANASTADLVPPVYRRLLRHSTEARMPVFSSEFDWPALGRDLSDWLDAERNAGRDVAVTSETAFHQLLVLADAAGLESVEVSLDTTIRARTRATWSARSIAIEWLWVGPFGLDAPQPGMPEILAKMLGVRVVEQQTSVTTIVVARPGLVANLHRTLADRHHQLLSYADAKREGLIEPTDVGAGDQGAVIELLANGRFILVVRNR